MCTYTKLYLAIYVSNRISQLRLSIAANSRERGPSHDKRKVCLEARRFVVMIYDVAAMLYRQFLRSDAPRSLIQQPFRWRRWWWRHAVHCLPHDGDDRMGFLVARRLQIWAGLFEAICHRRTFQFQMGLQKKPLSGSDACIVFRALMRCISKLYERTGILQFQFHKYLIAIFYGACINMKETLCMEVATSSFSVTSEPATFGVRTRTSVIQMLHDVLRRLPDTLLDRPMNGTTCWCCGCNAIESPFKKCDRCRVARYCSRPCQIDDWRRQHRDECEVIANTLNRNLLSRGQDACRGTQYDSLRCVLKNNCTRRLLSSKKEKRRLRCLRAAVGTDDEDAMVKVFEHYFGSICEDQGRCDAEDSPTARSSKQCYRAH